MQKNILRNIFLIAISLFLLAGFAFSQEETTQEESIISELTNQLEEANKIIEELTDYVIALEKENNKLLKRLKESNKTIEDQKDRIKKDQQEIIDLRTYLENAIKNCESRFFDIGGAVSYPLGGQLMFGVEIPRLPIGFYITFGLSTPPVIAEQITVNIFATGGVKIRF